MAGITEAPALLVDMKVETQRSDAVKVGKPSVAEEVWRLHVSLAAAVPNRQLVEHAVAPDAPGLGIDWAVDAIAAPRVR
jgi:hypothetical protein